MNTFVDVELSKETIWLESETILSNSRFTKCVFYLKDGKQTKNIVFSGVRFIDCKFMDEGWLDTLYMKTEHINSDFSS